MTTRLICGQCGTGNYRPVPGRPTLFRCTRCYHTAGRSDFEPDEGEALVVHFGVLCVTPED